jgi:O-acetyl-ADP-ribose deacetylase (regulator of RNase III)
VRTVLEAVQGDITTQQVDAIVNAANGSLLGGGGVDGAIHRAAGPKLLAECRTVRRTQWPDGLPVGNAVATGAGHLAARWVIHTVGPNVHRGETDPALLRSCFVRSLQEAGRVGASSVAFPAVSAGAYGWDVREVAAIATQAVTETLDAASAAPADAGGVAGITVVRFVLFGAAAYDAFTAALAPLRRSEGHTA